MIEVDKKEVARYLGYHGISPSPEVDARIDDCIKKLNEVSIPRHTVQVFDLTFPKENTLAFSDLSFESADLYKNTKGCHKIAMFAATIGIGVDRLIARAELTSMADASIFQAAGAAMIEAYCDEINRHIIQDFSKEGLYCRPRFSPGYGDVPLALQKDFARILNMSKTCGISLGETLLMSPSKSVTAFIGISKMNAPCIIQGCETCDNADTCEYRR